MATTRFTSFVAVVHFPYGEDPEALAEAQVLIGDWKYCVVSREVGRNRDTPHLHIYYILNTPRALAAQTRLIQRLFPHAHNEVARASVKANVAYAKKEERLFGTKNWAEFGQYPEESEVMINQLQELTAPRTNQARQFASRAEAAIELARKTI